MSKSCLISGLFKRMKITGKTFSTDQSSKITSIKVYQADLPLVAGPFFWADGKSVSAYDSTVVAIATDTGVTGYGEVVPLGPNYLASYAAGVRAGLKELGPHLLGEDPTKLKVLNSTMDYNLKGHPYVKSGIDMACWDILGKVCGQSVCTLLGGNSRGSTGVHLMRAISQDSPTAMAAKVTKLKEEGYSRFQLKLGGDPDLDIERLRECRAVLGRGDVLVGDANTGWTTHQALRVVQAVRDLDVYIEQPCRTFQECLIVRRATALPFVLDEIVEDIPSLMAVARDGAADAVNIKISKFGGLTRAKQAVDLCTELGIAMTIEDTWGGDINTAAILHLAHIAPEKLHFVSTAFNLYNLVSTGKMNNAVKTKDGRMTYPEGPGLGVEPCWDVLGEPQFVIQ